MKTYFSGIDQSIIIGTSRVSKNKINIMLSFFTSKNKPETLFQKIYNERKRIQKRRKTKWKLIE